MSRYFTGQACVHGHLAPRITGSGTCIVCHGSRRRRWQDSNLDAVNAAKRARRKHPEVRTKEKAAKAVWESKNPERLKAMKARSHQRHRDTAKVRMRRYYEATRDRDRGTRNEGNAAWRRANPDKGCDYAARRRAAKLNATPKWANTEAIKAIYAEAARLTRETGITHHVDHVVPLRGREVCGLHVETNLQILTARRNLEKGNRLEGDLQ